MAADLINAKDGAKLYTIKGIQLGCSVARMVTPFRWSRVHQRRTNDSFCLQPRLSPIPFTFARSAIGAATSKRFSRGIYLPCVGRFGGSSGRFINCRARPTFTDVIFTYIGCGAAITSGELHGRRQGDQEGILTVRFGWPANAQVSLEGIFGQRSKLTDHVSCDS
jgi:hypothetical protein